MADSVPSAVIPPGNATPATTTPPLHHNEFSEREMLAARKGFAFVFKGIVVMIVALIAVTVFAATYVIVADTEMFAPSDKAIVAKLIQITIGNVLGASALFLGVVLSWLGVTATVHLNATSEKVGGSFGLSTTSPGVVLIIGGCCLLALALYLPVGFFQVTQEGGGEWGGRQEIRVNPPVESDETTDDNRPSSPTKPTGRVTVTSVDSGRVFNLRDSIALFADESTDPGAQLLDSAANSRVQLLGVEEGRVRLRLENGDVAYAMREAFEAAIAPPPESPDDGTPSNESPADESLPAGNTDKPPARRPSIQITAVDAGRQLKLLDAVPFFTRMPVSDEVKSSVAFAKGADLELLSVGEMYAEVKDLASGEIGYARIDELAGAAEFAEVDPAPTPDTHPDNKPGSGEDDEKAPTSDAPPGDEPTNKTPPPEHQLLSWMKLTSALPLYATNPLGDTAASGVPLEAGATIQLISFALPYVEVQTEGAERKGFVDASTLFASAIASDDPMPTTPTADTTNPGTSTTDEDDSAANDLEAPGSDSDTASQFVSSRHTQGQAARRVWTRRRNRCATN